MNLPTPYKNVFITYTDSVYVPDKYYGHYETQKVTRRAFYSDSDGFYDRSDKWIETPIGYFSVPQSWGTFTFSDGTKALLPQGFNSHGRVFPMRINSWVYCE